MIFLSLLLLSAFTVYPDGNEGVKDNSSKKTEDILRRADMIIRHAEALSRKTVARAGKSGPSALKTYRKPYKPGVTSHKPVVASARYTAKIPVPSLMVMDCGRKDPGNLIRFMLAHNNDLDTIYLKRLIKTYILESRREGVNHDVAVCQMCLETGFLRFTGSVSRYQNNFCGLGAVNEWSGGDWFNSLEEGVRAHIQHLKAYASYEPVKPPVVDKRFDIVQRGTVVTIHDLTGKWAADPEYGIKIDYLLRTLYAK